MLPIRHAKFDSRWHLLELFRTSHSNPYDITSCLCEEMVADSTRPTVASDYPKMCESWRPDETPLLTVAPLFCAALLTLRQRGLPDFRYTQRPGAGRRCLTLPRLLTATLILLVLSNLPEL